MKILNNIKVIISLKLLIGNMTISMANITLLMVDIILILDNQDFYFIWKLSMLVQASSPKCKVWTKAEH